MKITLSLWNSGDMVLLKNEGKITIHHVGVHFYWVWKLMSCYLTSLHFHPVPMGSSLDVPVSSSRLKTCTWGRVETQSPYASCDYRWLSRAYSWWNLSLHLLKVPGYYRFRSRLFFFLLLLFFKIAFLLFWQNILSWRSIKIYIYFQCAQARRV